jgi:hypothetical protein
VKYLSPFILGNAGGQGKLVVIYAIFAAFFLFIFAYYFAYEHCRYKTAKILSEGLGGRAVFRIGRSYMRRDHDGAEERVWIDPDDKMAWPTSFLASSPAILFLQRKWNADFRFDIEPKTGILFRTLCMGTLKDSPFNVPRLDGSLRLRTDNHVEAAAYFFSPERQDALIALFLAGFTYVRGDHTAIVATMKGISTKNLNPQKIDLYLKRLSGVCKKR